MARALARLGHAVTVYCRIGESRRAAGVDYVPHGECRSHLENRGCNVFLSCRHHQVLARTLRADMIGLWNHDMPDPLFENMPRRALSKAAFSFFLSRFHRDEYEKYVPGISGYTALTTNGVDFRALGEISEGHPPDPAGPRFIYASRPERGLAVLLAKIWPAVRERFPEAQLLVTSYDLGSAALAESTRRHYELCDQLLVRTPGVRRLGHLTRRRFWTEMASCRAVLYPTDWPEVSCMVALEAQAMGVPIVTTDAFALHETVAFRETRIPEPWGSSEYVERFVKTVELLTEDESFHRRALEAGRRHVGPKSHSWDALAASWTNHFHECFGRRFEQNKAGVLRRLLQRRDLTAARRLVDSEGQGDFDPMDLADLQRISEEAAGAGKAEQDELDARIRRTPPLPKISATVLMKNEEAHIRRSIESFEGVADEILLGDTGSTDATLDIVRSMGFCEGPTGEPSRRRLLELELKDFAQARNALAAHASGDYLFWQDADEVLVGGSELRRWIDDNVFYDAFTIEQKQAVVDGRLESDWPVRCFRPETPDGPLQWVGCIHENVEHRANRPPRRTLQLSDTYVAHVGYLYESLRFEKESERNWHLFLKDRRENPDRMIGYALAIRAYLNLAQWELDEAGGMTRKAYRCLNWGFELWHRYVRHFEPAYRAVGFGYSREILRMLSRHGAKLRLTGQVPIEVHFSFAARRGGLDVDPRDVAAHRTYYAGAEELREELNANLDRLEADLGPSPPDWLAPPHREPTARHERFELPPELFDLDPFDAESRHEEPEDRLCGATPATSGR